MGNSIKRTALLATTLAALGAVPAIASDGMGQSGTMGESIEDLVERGRQTYYEDGQ